MFWVSMRYCNYFLNNTFLWLDFIKNNKKYSELHKTIKTCRNQKSK